LSRFKLLRRLFAIAAAFVLVFAFVGSALAHQVTKIVGTVDCQGNYSITVTGDVYGGVHLIVILGGNTIYDQAQNGTSATHDFGPFTGTGATAGESIMAKTSDGSQTSGELILTGGPCTKPDPKLTFAVTCEGTVTVHLNQDAVDTGWLVAITDVPVVHAQVFGKDPAFVVGDNVLPTTLSPGDYRWGVVNGSALIGEWTYFTVEACATPTPPEVTPTPTSTPIPVVTPTPKSTTTPPPTNTGSGSSSSSTPLIALLICAAFGALSLVAVEAQRRSVRH